MAAFVRKKHSVVVVNMSHLKYKNFVLERL